MSLLMYLTLLFKSILFMQFFSSGFENENLEIHLLCFLLVKVDYVFVHIVFQVLDGLPYLFD